MGIDAVLFDADDTLWDFQLAARSVTRSVLDLAAGVHPLIGQIDERHVIEIRRRLGLEYGQSDVVGLRRRTFELALCEVGVVDPALVDQLTEAFLDGLSRDLPLFPDTVPTLEQLAGQYRLGLVSNGTKGPEAGGLGRFFDATVLGPIEGVPKPDPELFLLALTRMGDVDPSRAIMVGDHDDYDVAGAHAAGIRAILLDRRNSGSSTAVAVIHQLAELPPTLARLA